MINSGQSYKFDFKKINLVAQESTKISKKILLKNFRKLETNIDIHVEDAIREVITNSFPDDNILGEERGLTKKTSDFTWIIDPLDGTKNYKLGIPSFSTSIALSYNNGLIFGLIDVPKSNDQYYAIKDQGAFLNGKKITVSDKKTLSDSIAYIEPPLNKRNIEKMNKLIENFFRIRTFGLGSLGLAFVAQGSVETYIDLSETTKLVDVAAGIILVQEAGGYVELDKPFDTNMTKVNFIWASNKGVKNNLQTILNKI